MSDRRLPVALAAIALLLAPAHAAWAQGADQTASDTAAQVFALHGQATFVLQGHDAFRSPYRGAQSLDPAARGDETADVTLYAGFQTPIGHRGLSWSALSGRGDEQPCVAGRGVKYPTGV